jgi:hypothetical protein
MTPEQAKRIVSLLLLFTGGLHLVVAYFGGVPDIQIALTLFGVSYSALGYWTQFGGRPAMTATLVVTTLGLTLGGFNYLTNGGPLSLPVMFAIDIAVIGLGAYWLRAQQKSR